jgi:hypothetical protein
MSFSSKDLEKTEKSNDDDDDKQPTNKVEIIKAVLSDTPQELEVVSPNSVTKKDWKKSQFKTLHQCGDKLVAEMEEGSARQEYAAYQQLIQMGIKVPNPKLVKFGGKVALQMDFEKGETLDINKTENPTVLFNIMVSALNGTKVDTSELGLIRLTKPPPKEVVEKLLKERSGEVADIKGTLRAILENSRTALISDLQVIIGKNGGVTVIDPLWVGSPNEITNPQEGMMFIKSYKRVYGMFLALGGKKTEIDAKDNVFLTKMVF